MNGRLIRIYQNLQIRSMLIYNIARQQIRETNVFSQITKSIIIDNANRQLYWTLL